MEKDLKSLSEKELKDLLRKVRRQEKERAISENEEKKNIIKKNNFFGFDKEMVK